jgi:transcriptional regulator with XRE-family HTH domain
MEKMAKKKDEAGLIEIIQEAIRSSGKSLNQLSKESGVTRPQLSRFMRGLRTITLPAAEQLCSILRLRLVSYAEEPGPTAATAKKRKRAKQ